MTLSELESKAIPVTESGCLLWTGHGNSYGTISMNGKRKYAHRLAWELVNGQIPESLFVCHHCDMPACIRIDHLFLGTSKENNFDSIRKGRINGKAHREKISLALTGRSISLETRLKLSQAQKGIRNFLGKKHTEETKEKMRIKATGRILSQETRAKISLARKRHHASNKSSNHCA
ncbi:MAG: NUMOD3 domain-containing DNA-binding protein [bacterium]